MTRILCAYSWQRGVTDHPGHLTNGYAFKNLFFLILFSMFHSTNQSDSEVETMEEFYSAEGIPVSSTGTQG